MSNTIMILAWAGAVLWPVAIAFGMWRGLKTGRGPGPFSWVAIFLVTTLWGLGLRAFIVEPEGLIVRRVEVVSQLWSGAPLRVGVITDVHGGGPHMSVGRLERIVDEMNGERPDIVLLLGDFAAGHDPAPDRSAGENAAVMATLPPLGKLRAPLGVWSVLGNHDWWYDGAAVEAGLQAQGITVLENARARIERPGGAFWLAGLADYESTRAKPSYGEALADLVDDDPVVVMSHWPDVFATAPDRVTITFAGHTHCGQVNLPFFGRLLHASPGSEKWPCGLYTSGERRLYVSGGVGVSIMPVRFNQPPEIAIVTLRAD
ncbi:MAG: metallophosphoesterase [Sphingobium sp.]